MRCCALLATMLTCPGLSAAPERCLAMHGLMQRAPCIRPQAALPDLVAAMPLSRASSAALDSSYAYATYIMHHASRITLGLNPPSFRCSTGRNSTSMLHRHTPRGILSELGLKQDAVRNVYLPAHPPRPSKAASSKSGEGPGEDAGALKGVPPVSELMRGWFGGGSKLLSQGSSAPAQASFVGSSTDPRKLQVCCPTGQILIYSPAL
jgi:hypothetical protein